MAQETPAASDFSLSLEPTAPSGRRVTDVLRRRWLIVLGVAMGIWGVAIFMALSKEKIYRATALLLVTQKETRAQSGEISTPAEEWIRIQNERLIHLRVIRSSDIASRVIETLALDLPLAYLLRQVQCEELKQSNLFSLTFEDTDPERAQRIVNTWAQIYVDKVREQGAQSIKAALSYVEEQIASIGSQLIQIDQQLASQQVEQQQQGISSDALNRLMQLKANLASNGAEQAALMAQIREIDRLIAEEKKNLKKFAKKNEKNGGEPQTGISDVSTLKTEGKKVPPPVQTSLQRLAQNSQNYLHPPEKSIALSQVGESVTTPPKQSSSGFGHTAEQVSIAAQTSEQAQTLGNQLNQLWLRRQQLLEKYYEDSPQVQAIDEQIHILQNQYQRALSASKISSWEEAKLPLQRQIASLKAQAAVLEKQIALQEQAAGLSPWAQVTLDDLQRRRTVLEKLNSTLLEKRNELQLQKAMVVPSVQIVEYADVPRTPVGPKVGQIAGIGLFLGILIGLTLALLVDQIEDTFGDVDEIERYTGVRLLGTVLQVKNKEELSLEAFRQSQSVFGGSVRMLASMLRLEMERSGIRSFVVTSGNKGSGKTTLAAAIGYALAGTGDSVLLIDGDLHNPRLHRYFGLKNEPPGLSSVLTRQSTLEEAVVETGIPGLRLLTSGIKPPIPADLFGSEEARAAIQEINKAADIVIWDTPPAVLVPDAMILAREVKGALVIVGRKDKRRMVRESISMLRTANAHILGTVANGVRPAGGSYYYYYYYYYYRYYPYGYGKSEEASSEEKS